MREILFRGKIGKDWVYGDLQHFKVSTAIFRDNHTFPYLVDPETVGQYTGLTDRNGKKIFEGDIVKNIDGVYVVKYCDSLTCYALVRDSMISGRPVSSGTVIGNIHDNPELLGGD